MIRVSIIMALVALSHAGVPLGYGLAVGPAHGIAVAAPVHEKTTVLANSAPGTGGHAPNNLITLLRTQDGGYVPGDEPDPPAIQRPSSTVYRSDDSIHAGVVGVGPHGEAVHAGRPFEYGYINRNEHGGSYNHHEKSDAGNRRTGSYGFTGADGTYRQVDYVADENGYRAKVSTNEQGTSSHAAADALTVAEKPPYLQYSPPAAPVAQVVKAAPVFHAPQVLHAAPTYAAATPVFHAPQVLHAAPTYAAATPVYQSARYPAPGLPLVAIRNQAQALANRGISVGSLGLGQVGLARGGLALGQYGLSRGGYGLGQVGLAHGGLALGQYGLARGGYGLGQVGLSHGAGLIQAPGIVPRGLGLSAYQGGLIHG